MRINITKKITVLSFLVVFVLSQAACTTCRMLPTNTTADIKQIYFEPNKEYEVEFTTKERYKLKGNQLTASSNLIGIRTSEETGYKYYDRNSFSKICVHEKDPGKTRWAIAGGVVGGLILVGGIITGIVLGSMAESY